jgi:hypothetical protein
MQVLVLVEELPDEAVVSAPPVCLIALMVD